MGSYKANKAYQKEYINALPSIGVPNGSKSFIAGEVFLWDGAEWGYIQTENLIPTWDNRIDANVFLQQGGIASTIDFGVTDPEGASLQYSLSFPTFTTSLPDPIDSYTFDNDTGVLVVTPINSADDCEKLIRVTVTDGLNTVNKDVLLTLTAGSKVSVPGGAIWTKPGTYVWAVPEGISSICIACIGAGGGGSGIQTTTLSSGAGGGGGACSYANDVVFTFPTSGELTIVVGAGGAGGTINTAGSNGGTSSVTKDGVVVCSAAGGNGAVFASGGAGGDIGVALAGDGGNGGNGTTGEGSTGGGGGGAGGYSGNGGNGGNSSFLDNNTYPQNGTNGAGGGSAGGDEALSSPGVTAGGGTGIYGAGANGTVVSNGDGIGGSGGQDGQDGIGGYPGGGGCGTAYTTNMSAGFGKAGANGAVRIIWGPGRSYPVTNVGTAESVVQEQDYSL